VTWAFNTTPKAEKEIVALGSIARGRVKDFLQRLA
jgi:hypothetical protein